MKEKLKNLLTVKSIVTIVLTAAFTYLSVTGQISPAQFLTIFTVIVAFYFGTQKQKQDNEVEDLMKRKTREVITMNEVSEIIVAILSSGALATIISWIFQLISNKRANKNALAKAVKELLAAKIEDKATAYLERGYIIKAELDTLIRLDEAYHKLGGNGFYDTNDKGKRTAIGNGIKEGQIMYDEVLKADVKIQNEVTAENRGG